MLISTTEPESMREIPSPVSSRALSTVIRKPLAEILNMPTAFDVKKVPSPEWRSLQVVRLPFPYRAPDLVKLWSQVPVWRGIASGGGPASVSLKLAIAFGTMRRLPLTYDFFHRRSPHLCCWDLGAGPHALRGHLLGEASRHQQGPRLV